MIILPDALSRLFVGPDGAMPSDGWSFLFELSYAFGYEFRYALALISVHCFDLIGRLSARLVAPGLGLEALTILFNTTFLYVWFCSGGGFFSSLAGKRPKLPIVGDVAEQQSEP